MLNQNSSPNGLAADHEPEDEGLEQTPVEPAVTNTRPGQAPAKMKKFEAVRLALEAGQDSTKDAVPWIKQKFDLDITEATFNNYKSTLKNKTKNDEDHETLGDILRRENIKIGEVLKAVKDLVDLCGGETVKDLVDFFDD